MATNKQNSKKIIITSIGLVVIAAFVVTIGVTFHNIRNHQSPNDIKSFVISSYNGSQSPDTQRSQTLTLTPTSCSYVTMSPSDGNFSPTTNCPMNSTIWSSLTSAYFSNSLPTQSAGQTTPVSGPILLLGVYYNDGTSNTVYFTKPLPANFSSFLETVKSSEPTANSL